MAAWAVEQHPVDAVVAAGVREAEQLARLHALPPAVLRPLQQAAGGDWRPSTKGTAADALTTVASVLQVLREITGLAMAMKHAVSLGGDTDTAAAIVGGLLGCQAENVEPEIPWLPSVTLPALALIEATATGLYDLRRAYCP
jgi:hypothetical protein